MSTLTNEIAAELPRPEKQMVYFVLQGEMHSTWIIGHVDFAVASAPSQQYTNEYDVAAGMFNNSKDGTRVSTISGSLLQMVKRPGRWYYLAGGYTMHADDCYDSKQAAAHAEFQRLLGE